MTDFQLTNEQQEIVNHDRGPAIVLAVAGAGKTLAMEQRIARLVADGVFAQQRILATTFNKSAASELQERIRQHPGCTAFEATTLHALGFKITRFAYKQGLLTYLHPNSFNDIDGADRKTLYGAIRRARAQNVPYAQSLNGFDHEDFLTYVGLCKGQLMYPDQPALRRLPENAQTQATLATAPQHNPWYLNLYRIYEAERVEQGLYTFDDQIMTGWELLATNSEVRREFQGRYDCVVVDEFQDVNRAQAEMLDLLVQSHRNYMVVGDDDQTIYTWRGADPSYIRNFQQRYQAQRYYLTENFRCSAPQIAIANSVIKFNRQRELKKLHLTQGFEGEARIDKPRSQPEMARRIVAAIQNAQANGGKYNDVAILVRVYAQTGPIEQALIEADIPYEVIGGKRFFDRPEIKVLIDYCRLAFFEQRLQRCDPLGAAQQEQVRASWNEVYRLPSRYVKRQDANKLISTVLRKNQPITAVLRDCSSQFQVSIEKKLNELADILEWLAGSHWTGIDAPETAYKALGELIHRLEYRDYLRKRSEFSGVEEVENIDAFLRYSLKKGNLNRFLAGVRDLSQEADDSEQDEDRVGVLTMHRAKGLEWPIVLIPDCNEEIIPHKRAIDPDALEEERRLLYVAITRSKRQLLLYSVNTKTKRPSSFLIQAQAETVLEDVAKAKGALEKKPNTWMQDEKRALQRAMKEYGFDRHLMGSAGLSVELCDELRTLANSGEIMVPASPAPGGVKQPKAATKARRRGSSATTRASNQGASAKASARNWPKGSTVHHSKHGKGRVEKIVTLNGKSWIEVRFGGNSFIQVDPREIRRSR